MEKLIDLLMPGLRFQEAALERAVEYLKVLPETLRKHGNNMEWQPIETAPKRGKIIVYRPAYVLTHDSMGEPYDRAYNEPETYLITYRRERMYPPPTHWMPLPEPPNAVA